MHTHQPRTHTQLLEYTCSAANAAAHTARALVPLVARALQTRTLRKQANSRQATQQATQQVTQQATQQQTLLQNQQQQQHTVPKLDLSAVHSMMQGSPSFPCAVHDNSNSMRNDDVYDSCESNSNNKDNSPDEKSNSKQYYNNKANTHMHRNDMDTNASAATAASAFTKEGCGPGPIIVGNNKNTNNENTHGEEIQGEQHEGCSMDMQGSPQHVRVAVHGRASLDAAQGGRVGSGGKWTWLDTGMVLMVIVVFVFALYIGFPLYIVFSLYIVQHIFTSTVHINCTHHRCTHKLNRPSTHPSPLTHPPSLHPPRFTQPLCSSIPQSYCQCRPHATQGTLPYCCDC